jgi:aminocarboxymuconate-semialdehyde decarboxylase
MEIWNRYGPTAARVHGKPGRAVRPSSQTIDVHSHVAVPEAAQFVKPHLDFGSIPLVKFATTDTRALNQRQDADRTSRMTKHDERLADSKRWELTYRW